MWVIGVLSIVTVVDRIYYTYLELNGRPQPRAKGLNGLFVRAFYWTDERATFAYDLWVIAILAFVWLTPPDWLGDPMAVGGPGLVQIDQFRSVVEVRDVDRLARRASDRNSAGTAPRRCLSRRPARAPSTPPAAACDSPGPPQTMQIASVLVMYSAIASSCGIGSNGLPR